MIILGIDPGSNTTGYAFLEKSSSDARNALSGNLRVLKYGAICADKTAAPEDRLVYIIQELEKLLEEYKPQALSMEGVFYSKNVKSTLMLGQIRGAILVACRRRGLTYNEYSPRSVKQAVTGDGAASKEQVAAMVSRLLNVELKGPLDASDALAIAYTHAAPPPISSLIPKPAKKKKTSTNAMRELILKMGGTLPK